jgi:hypothetical protein
LSVYFEGEEETYHRQNDDERDKLSLHKRSS